MELDSIRNFISLLVNEPIYLLILMFSIIVVMFLFLYFVGKNTLNISIKEFENGKTFNYSNDGMELEISKNTGWKIKDDSFIKDDFDINILSCEVIQ